MFNMDAETGKILNACQKLKDVEWRMEAVILAVKNGG
jgi:hypothetical protein